MTSKGVIFGILLLALISGAFFLSFRAKQMDRSSDAPQSPTAVAKIGTYSLIEFKRVLGTDDVTLIDVRTPEEYAEGHIKNARLINFNDTENFNREVNALPKQAKYLIYCKSGNRSRQALSYMQLVGFTDVHDLQGGTGNWLAAGEELVKD